jgi:hypothetical protein
VDPLEAGMDRPEHWSEADRRSMTPRGQAGRETLDERLAQERPDVNSAPEDARYTDDERPDSDPTGEIPVAGTSYDEDLGTPADVAGGSMADEIRKPPPE